MLCHRCPVWTRWYSCTEMTLVCWCMSAGSWLYHQYTHCCLVKGIHENSHYLLHILAHLPLILAPPFLVLWQVSLGTRPSLTAHQCSLTSCYPGRTRGYTGTQMIPEYCCTGAGSRHCWFHTRYYLEDNTHTTLDCDVVKTTIRHDIIIT